MSDDNDDVTDQYQNLVPMALDNREEWKTAENG